MWPYILLSMTPPTNEKPSFEPSRTPPKSIHELHANNKTSREPRSAAISMGRAKCATAERGASAKTEKWGGFVARVRCVFLFSSAPLLPVCSIVYIEQKNAS